jgi:hypothetical protein
MVNDLNDEILSYSAISLVFISADDPAHEKIVEEKMIR